MSSQSHGGVVVIECTAFPLGGCGGLYSMEGGGEWMHNLADKESLAPVVVIAYATLPHPLVPSPRLV